MFISHPGYDLESHLRFVGRHIKEHIEQTSFSNYFTLSLCGINKEILKCVGCIIGIFHDFGKFTSFFQQYIKGNMKRSRETHHSCISAFIGSLFFKEMVLPLLLNENDLFLNAIPAIIYLIIRRHHSSLIFYEYELNEDTSDNGILNEWSQLPNLIESMKNSKDSIIDIYLKLIQEVCCDININKPLFNEWMCSVINCRFREFKEIKEYIKELRKSLNKLLSSYTKDFNADHFLIFILIQYLYSLLMEYDKISASGEKCVKTTIEYTLNIKGFIKNKLTIEKNNVPVNDLRNEFFNEVECFFNNEIKENKLSGRKHKIFTITAPTGIGKTLASLNFVNLVREKIMRETGSYYRILYFLPFTSIIDQNYEVLDQVFEFSIGNDYAKKKHRYLLKHHHLSEIIYKQEGEEISIEKILLLIQSWESGMIVSTFYQFFYTIFGYHSSTLMKFNKLVNSIIILDEVQNLPPKYWSILEKYINTLTKYFNTYVILLTATQPAIFDKESVSSVIKNPEKYFNAPSLNRICFCFHQDEVFLYLKNFPNNDMISNKITKFLDSEYKSIMFVTNTINQSICILKIIRQLLDQKFNNNYELNKTRIKPELIYLSTNITPKERKERIQKIKDFSDYTDNVPSRKLIVVSTQLIEAGVDIDIDIIVRDLGPLDCLIQVAGRCNRNKRLQGRGHYHVYIFKDDNNKRFCSYIYDKTLIEDTECILTNGGSIINHSKWEESVFFNFAEKYFQKVREKIAESYKDYYKLFKYLKFKGTKHYKSKTKYVSQFRLFEKEIEKIAIYIPFDENIEKLLDDFSKTQDKITSFWQDQEQKQKILNLKDYLSFKMKLRRIQNKLRNYSIEIPQNIFEDMKEKAAFQERWKNLQYSLYVLKRDRLLEFYDSIYGVKRELG
ncbi:MAG: CRISPR-associated helicase Cas3' [Promethearchaeota archaeon]